MVRRNATHETSLTVRLLGPHEVTAQVIGGRLQVMMPGAVITIADTSALISVYGAWVEASVIAWSVFTGDRRSLRLFHEPAQRVIGAVLISGKQPDPTIHGKAPEASPSGCGQVIVRVGRLTTVCDDQAAWASQDTGWRTACEKAAVGWNGPKLSQVAAAAERRALTRVDRTRPFSPTART